MIITIHREVARNQTMGAKGANILDRKPCLLIQEIIIIACATIT